MAKSKKLVKYIRSVSPFGKTSEKVFPKNLFSPAHFLHFDKSERVWSGKIPQKIPQGKFDRSTGLALSLLEDLPEYDTDALLIASYSRGATESLEKHFADFLQGGKVSPRTSPQTTLAALSNFLAEKLHLQNSPAYVLSATCAGGLLGVWNAELWLNAGNRSAFVFASEAPLTSFTIAQIKALRIYSPADSKKDFPSTPLLNSKQNSFVLGEAAAMLYLENSEEISEGDIFIEKTGYYRKTETTETSISEEAFLQAMLQAAGNFPPQVVITHAPGTIMGDKKELSAIKKLFPEAAVTNLKWKVGHTFGASGLMNFVLGYHILKEQKFLQIPYLTKQFPNFPIKNVLVNAAGFGGHVVSVLLRKI